MDRPSRVILAVLVSVVMLPAARNVAAQEKKAPTPEVSAEQSDSVGGRKEPKKITEPDGGGSVRGRMLTVEQWCMYSSTGIGVGYRATKNPDGTRTTRGAGAGGYPTVGHLCPDSPAERAGFVAGDLILDVNGVDAREHSPLAGTRPGVTYVVRIRRDGTEREIELTPVKRAPPVPR